MGASAKSRMSSMLEEIKIFILSRKISSRHKPPFNFIGVYMEGRRFRGSILDVMDAIFISLV